MDVKENPVMIYMKGVREMPRCGFSSLAVRALKEHNVPFGARNLFEHLDLKDAVKAYSRWKIKMASNVLGTPITDETLRGLQNRNYRDKQHITQKDRARVAMEMKNAEGKDVNAREMAEYLKEQFGAEDDVVTMGLIYNATGCAITVVRDCEWEGHLGQSPYPLVIQNGQWGVFVHGKCGNGPNYSKALVVYSGKTNDGQYYRWCIAWANNRTMAQGQNRLSVGILDSSVYKNDDLDNALSNYLDLVEKQLVSRCNECGGFMIGSIGNDRVAFLETILTLPDAIN